MPTRGLYYRLRVSPHACCLAEVAEDLLAQLNQAKDDAGDCQWRTAKDDDVKRAKDVSCLPADYLAKPFPKPHGKEQGHTAEHQHED